MEDEKLQKISDTIKTMVTDVKIKAKELREKYEFLMKLKDYGIDLELPDLKTLVSPNGDSYVDRPLPTRPDEYFGLSNTVAAAKYLEKVGHAASLDDIYNALISGGITFTGNGKANLNVQLTRATRMFAKIGSGNNISFGLIDWYPSRVKKKILKTSDLEEEKKEEETIVHEDSISKVDELPEQEETVIKRSRRTKF
jgi:hypothetical protein